ncbi:hypothetical protein METBISCDRAFT_31348 [Metschnikowia bicuspidata]|uniref:Large ribosomal subunit protein bL32m n=1 Tax=Metschnikowia bicuspidata TaxID=27322 RepID=A0A4P9ZAN7_9ASCO|nr:hypothetical protein METBISCDRAFT_31348 [Metschnikowia bicuspidata]
MSAVLRMASFLIALSLPVVPRLPTISQLLPKWPSWSKPANTDPRLQELKALLERGEDVPFTFDKGGILRAVPKKKPSYRRTREKRLSPGDKQIQPLENLGRCAACGRVKRSHFMCMHCFGEIRTFLKEKKKQLWGKPAWYEPVMDEVDQRIVFPKRRLSDEELQYKQREYVPVREKPLEYSQKAVKKQ